MIRTTVFLIFQLTGTPGLSYLYGREYYQLKFASIRPMNPGSLYYLLLFLPTICGGVIHFIYLLYLDSKTLKHKNKKLNLESSLALKTILG